MMTSFYLDSSDCYEWYPKIGMFVNNCFLAENKQNDDNIVDFPEKHVYGKRAALGFTLHKQYTA